MKFFSYRISFSEKKTAGFVPAVEDQLMREYSDLLDFRLCLGIVFGCRG